MGNKRHVDQCYRKEDTDKPTSMKGVSYKTKVPKISTGEKIANSTISTGKMENHI